MPHSESQGSPTGRGENRSTMMEITENYSLVFLRDILHADRFEGLSRYDNPSPLWRKWSGIRPLYDLLESYWIDLIRFVMIS